MDDVCSLTCPPMAGIASATARDASRSFVRWAVVGAASAVLFVLALMQGGMVGAAAPATYDNTICINYTTCYPTTTTTTATTPTNTTSGYPANTVVSTYFDARYCNGLVSVVTDGSGNLIDVCTVTGQRIYPVFPDYGVGVNVGAGFIGPNYLNGAFVNGGFIPPGTANGITCNGLYGCPLGGGFIGNGNFVNGNFNYLNGNVCGFTNCNAFPAGGTAIGGVIYYNDNRFCTDGMIAFVPGHGYFCQNGGPLVTNNTTTTVNCGNFFLNGCGIYRPFEASATTAAPKQATTVTAYAAPAAPKAAAPLTQAAAPAVQAVVAPQAPVTAPMAPMTAKAAPATSTPAQATDPDDHRG